MYINGWTREKLMKQIRLKNKGYRSYDNGECRYRDDDNNQCLVGCFIPDVKYSTDMESRSATCIIREFDLYKEMPLSIERMDSLQFFHDAVVEDLDGESFYEAVEEKLIDMESKK